MARKLNSSSHKQLHKRTSFEFANWFFAFLIYRYQFFLSENLFASFSPSIWRRHVQSAFKNVQRWSPKMGFAISLNSQRWTANKMKKKCENIFAETDNKTRGRRIDLELNYFSLFMRSQRMELFCVFFFHCAILFDGLGSKRFSLSVWQLFLWIFITTKIKN